MLGEEQRGGRWLGRKNQRRPNLGSEIREILLKKRHFRWDPKEPAKKRP